MRHRRLRRKLGVKTAHRSALLRNLVKNLVAHKRIRTTYAKAKEASAFTDKMVTIAKRSGLHARRLLVSRLGCAATAKLLIQDVAPKFKERAGGYTRVLRLNARPGDGAEMALLEFTALFEAPEKVQKPKKEKKIKETEIVKEKAKAKPEEKDRPKEKKPAPQAEVRKEKASEKKEAEKKGGFLGMLRKFLKGDDEKK